MNLRVRRVVTGHDAGGKAIVAIDESAGNVFSPRPGQQSCVIWADEQIPVDNLDPADGARKPKSTVVPHGAVFRIVRFDAGRVGNMHRTNSVDYGVVLSGTIVLVLDDEAEVTLHAGDTIVQRGTVHNWINRTAEPCTIAFVLIDAQPLDAAFTRP